MYKFAQKKRFYSFNVFAETKMTTSNGNGKVMSGDEFNSAFPDTKFYKLTNKNEVHNEFRFKTGLNVDVLSFSPSGKCSAGGLYFTELQHIPLWLDYRPEICCIRDVIIPEDARVYIEEKKFKADDSYWALQFRSKTVLCGNQFLSEG